MACDLGVSVSVVSAWENGVRFPSISHLLRLSAYTGVPVCQFLYPHPWDCPNCRPDGGLDPYIHGLFSTYCGKTAAAGEGNSLDDVPT